MLSVRSNRPKEQRHVRLPTALTLEEKDRIGRQELEALTKDMEQTKRTSEQNLDILRALTEETDIRTAEVKRDAYEFRRDIVVGAENPRTGKTMAEKVLKYMEDKLTQKDMLINMKSRLSNLTAEAKLLEDEINERKAMLKKTEHDIQKVIEEKESARKEHKKLKVQCRQGPDMPKVVDYVSQKA